jgi:hypothetical protein
MARRLKKLPDRLTAVDGIASALARRTMERRLPQNAAAEAGAKE